MKRLSVSSGVTFYALCGSFAAIAILTASGCGGGGGSTAVPISTTARSFTLRNLAGDMVTYGVGKGASGNPLLVGLIGNGQGYVPIGSESIGGSFTPFTSGGQPVLGAPTPFTGSVVPINTQAGTAYLADLTTGKATLLGSDTRVYAADATGAYLASPIGGVGGDSRVVNLVRPDGSSRMIATTLTGYLAPVGLAGAAGQETVAANVLPPENASEPFAALSALSRVHRGRQGRQTGSTDPIDPIYLVVPVVIRGGTTFPVPIPSGKSAQLVGMEATGRVYGTLLDIGDSPVTGGTGKSARAFSWAIGETSVTILPTLHSGDSTTVLQVNAAGEAAGFETSEDGSSSVAAEWGSGTALDVSKTVKNGGGLTFEVADAIGPDGSLVVEAGGKQYFLAPNSP